MTSSSIFLISLKIILTTITDFEKHCHQIILHYLLTTRYLIFFPFILWSEKSSSSSSQWWISTEYSASRTSGMIETINIDLKMMRIILRKSFVNLVKHMLLFTVSFALWFLVFPPTLRCYVLRSVSFYPRSPDCPRVVEDKINQCSSVKLSLPFFSCQDGSLLPRMLFEGYWNFHRNIRKKTANSMVVIFITQAF